VGVVADGPATTLSLVDVEILDSQTEDGSYGYGISITEATTTLTDVTVSGASTVGVLISAADVQASNLRIEDVSPDEDDALGVGLWVQEGSVLSIEGCDIQDTLVAGIRLVETYEADIEGCTIDTVAMGVSVSGVEMGDGIVATQSTDAHNYDPATFAHSLVDNTVTGAARAGILLDGISAELEGNQAGDDNGYSIDGVSIFAQGDAVTSGSDPVVSLEEDGEYAPLDW
jgi:hypothetical protein